MTLPGGLVDRSLAEFARAAADRGAVPGSGSVAAAVGALGAGLASMALAPARDEGHSGGTSAELLRSMEELLARVDRDAQAYAAYLEARKGRGELRSAIERSIAVPREVAEEALAALTRLEAGFSAVKPRLHSEAVTAAQALLAAVEGAAFTARSNLSALDDARQRERRERELAALCARARELARAVQRHAGGAEPGGER